MLNQILNYSGAFILVLIIIYGVKNYLITLLAGFVVFCAFYFSYGSDNENFEFSISSSLKAVGHAALIYIIPYLAGVALYASTRKRNKKIEVDPLPTEKEKAA